MSSLSWGLSTRTIEPLGYLGHTAAPQRLSLTSSTYESERCGDSPPHYVVENWTHFPLDHKWWHYHHNSEWKHILLKQNLPKNLPAIASHKQNTLEIMNYPVWIIALGLIQSCNYKQFNECGKGVYSLRSHGFAVSTAHNKVCRYYHLLLDKIQVHRKVG